MGSIARERIDRLLALARRATREGDVDLGRRHVRRARRIAERHREPVGRLFTRLTCDACDRYQLPGVTTSVRLRDGHVVYRCACGHIARYPYDG